MTVVVYCDVKDKKITVLKTDTANLPSILEMACDPTKSADLAAVVMQEGLAHLCLITPNMTLVRAKIETNIPRKRKGMCGQHDKVSETNLYSFIPTIDPMSLTIFT